MGCGFGEESAMTCVSWPFDSCFYYEGYVGFFFLDGCEMKDSINGDKWYLRIFGVPSIGVFKPR